MRKLTDESENQYNEEKPVRCKCGKLIAIERDGRIYVYCKSCKRQIPIEPRA